MDLVSILYTILIPVLLILIMVGLGLSLTLTDLKRVVFFPKAAAIGISGQLILLPLLAFVLAFFLAPSPEVAVGAIILAACPGGVTSNAYVFAARADVALSVTLTAVVSFVTVFTIPLLTYVSLLFFFQEGAIPDLPVLRMFRTLALLTVVPISGGMIFRMVWPVLAQKMVETVRRVAVIALTLLIATAAASSYEVILDNVLQAGLLVIALNLLSMGMGFGIARVFKLTTSQAVTITYEIGVQNISLALLVTLTLLDNPAFAITSLLYAVIMPITALGFISIARTMLARAEARENVEVPGGAV
ncbi:MAG: bile acid:sodium symporter family protein [Gammaproteobacteria bacterium]